MVITSIQSNYKMRSSVVPAQMFESHHFKSGNVYVWKILSLLKICWFHTKKQTFSTDVVFHMYTLHQLGVTLCKILGKIMIFLESLLFLYFFFQMSTNLGFKGLHRSRMLSMDFKKLSICWREECLYFHKIDL